jgi:hypothetical protein
VLAGLGGGDRDLGMAVVGRDDVDQVDVGTGDDGAPVAGRLFESEALAAAAGLMSTSTLRTGIKGAGQKNIGMAA